MVECVKSCDEFQMLIMRPLIYQIIKRSMPQFTYEGLEHLEKGKHYLFVSNHRDITLDAALLDYVLLNNGYVSPEVGFGNNLIKNDMIADIFRLNKMFTILRGGTRREFYNNSLYLSSYIHYALFEKGESVWIAQRNGRTKDGDDRTDQGLLKMFSMAGSGDFETEFNRLQIVPVAVSYEYEPCDRAKTVETYVSQSGIYTKSANEDMLSIMQGILQQKGAGHICICDPITPEEVAHCASLNKNECFAGLATIIDQRIHQGYKLFKTNYIAADLQSGKPVYDDYYTTDELEQFIAYSNKHSFVSPSDASMRKLMDLYLSIYANPLKNKVSQSH